MPLKKKNNQPEMDPQKVDAHFNAIEGEIRGLKASITKMQTKIDDNLALLFEKITEGFEWRRKVTNVDDEESETKKSGSESGLKKLQGESLEEFKQLVKKIELPMFEGHDLAGWITRAEIYFRVQNTNPDVRVNLAQLCMDGPPIHFFKSVLDDDEELTWDKLKIELIERYGGIGESDVHEQLSALKQRGEVDEYIQKFEYLTAQVRKLPDDQYFGYFLHGLKEDTRGRIRSLRALGPLTRSRLMNVARAMEREVQGKRGSTMFGSHCKNE